MKPSCSLTRQNQVLDFYSVVNHLFAGDKILPSQMIPTRKLSGVRQMYLASFEDAIELLRRGTLLGQNPAANYQIKRLAYQTIQWVLDESDSWGFSFARHCVVLGLDEGRMRKGMVALYQRYFGQEIVPPRQKPGLNGGRRRTGPGMDTSYRRIWHEYDDTVPNLPIRAEITVGRDTIDLGRFKSPGIAKSVCGWRYQREIVTRQKKAA